MTPALRYGVPALAGVILASAQAPWNFAYGILPALAVLALVMKGQSPRIAAVQGWIAAAAQFIVALHWISNPFRVEADIYGWMAPFAVILLPAGLALFWAAGGWIGARIGTYAGWALGLMLAEFGRAVLFTGFPWAQVAQGFLDTQASRLVPFLGAYGLTYLAFATAACLAWAASGKRRWPVVLLGVLPALLWAPLPMQDDTAPVVRLVQPNAEQEQKWDPDHAEAFLDYMLTATRAAGHPSLVIWPETAVPYLLNYADMVLEDIAEASGGVPVVLGMNREEGALYYNSLVTVGQGGAVLSTYDKRHLVPFGEYIPGGELLADLGIHGLAARDGAAYAVGSHDGLTDIDGIGAFLPLICYEGIFPAMSSSDLRPRFLLLITNDAWFGPDAGPLQHFAQARLRALEQGVPMVRVGNTGITAVIDAHGAVTASLPFQSQGYLDASLPPILPVTVFGRFGAWAGWVVIFLTGLFVVQGLKQNRR